MYNWRKTLRGKSANPKIGAINIVLYYLVAQIYREESALPLHYGYAQSKDHYYIDSRGTRAIREYCPYPYGSVSSSTAGASDPAGGRGDGQYSDSQGGALVAGHGSAIASAVRRGTFGGARRYTPTRGTTQIRRDDGAAHPGPTGRCTTGGTRHLERAPGGPDPGRCVCPPGVARAKTARHSSATPPQLVCEH